MKTKRNHNSRKPIVAVVATVAALGAMSGACSKKKSSSTSTTSTSTSGGSTGGTTASTLVTTNSSGVVITNLTNPGALALAGSLQILPGASGKASASLALAGVTGDYDKAKSGFNIQDPSLNMLQMLNNTILPCITASGYADTRVLNKGLYVAQVDSSTCSDGGSSSSGKTEIPFVVESTGTTDSAGNILTLDSDMWFVMKGEQQINVAVHLRDNPVLEMEFISTSIDSKGAQSSPYQEQGRIILSKDKSDPTKVSLTMTDVSTDPDQFSNDQMAVNIKTDANGTPVSGLIQVSINESQKGGDGKARTNKATVQAAYDASHFFANDSIAGQTCKDQTSFTYNIYQYGVYNTSDHNVVKMNGGFPVNYTDPVTGGSANAYASYYGISTQNQSALPTGTVLTRANPDAAGNKGDTYTVFAGPGRLMKITRQVLKLDDLDGMALSYNAPGGSTSYCATWSKAAQQFQVTGVQTFGNYGPSCSTQTAAKLTLAPIHDQLQYQGGNQIIVATDASGTPKSAYSLVNTDVTASAGNLSLSCVVNCLQGNVSQTLINSIAASMGNNNGGGSQPPSAYLTGLTLAAPAAYTYNQAKFQLVDANGNPAGLASGVTWPASSGGNGGGVSLMSGTMVDATTLAAVRASGVQVCSQGGAPTVSGSGPSGSGSLSLSGSPTTSATGPANPPPQSNCVMDPFVGVEVAYQWQTGSSPWSQYQGLKDSTGAIVTFDPPINMPYVHSQTYDAANSATSRYYGKTVMLSWDGSNLNGIPGSNDPTNNGYFTNDFGILPGATAGATGQYLLRPLRGNEFMKSLPITTCTAANLSYASGLPDLPALNNFQAASANTAAKPSSASLPTCFIDMVYQGCNG